MKDIKREELLEKVHNYSVELMEAVKNDTEIYPNLKEIADDIWMDIRGTVFNAMDLVHEQKTKNYDR